MFYREFGRSSAVGTAILRHDLGLLENLLRQRADPDAPDEKGWRPLHVAVSEIDSGGPAEIVSLLLKHGADVNAWDVGHNEAPILTASDPPKREVVRMLLEAGADSNVVRCDGESALRLAVQAKDLELAKLLLRFGADRTIDQYGGIFGLNALALAAMDFNVPMIELLLNAGANPNAIQEFGETPRDKLPPREEHDPREWDRVMEMLGYPKG